MPPEEKLDRKEALRRVDAVSDKYFNALENADKDALHAAFKDIQELHLQGHIGLENFKEYEDEVKGIMEKGFPQEEVEAVERGIKPPKEEPPVEKAPEEKKPVPTEEDEHIKRVNKIITKFNKIFLALRLRDSEQIEKYGKKYDDLYEQHKDDPEKMHTALTGLLDELSQEIGPENVELLANWADKEDQMVSGKLFPKDYGNYYGKRKSIYNKKR
ncbi:hypothetical protein ACFLQ2_01005 [archaeon]